MKVYVVTELGPSRAAQVWPTCLKTIDESAGSSGGSLGTGTEGMGTKYGPPDLISTSAGTLDGSSCHSHERM